MVEQSEAGQKQEEYELLKRALLSYAKNNEGLAKEAIDNILDRLLVIFNKSKIYEIEVNKMEEKYDKSKLKSEFAKKYGYKSSDLTDEFLAEIFNERMENIKGEMKLIGRVYGFEVSEKSKKYTESLMDISAHDPSWELN